MSDLEEVHRLLADVEEVLERLDRIKQNEVDVDDVADLCLALGELSGWGTAYGSDLNLGVSPAILTRYIKLRGPFPTREARLIASRLRTYLRSQDQRQAVSTTSSVHPEVDPPATTPPSEGIVVEAEGWKLVGTSSAVKAQILAISSLLDSVVERARGANYGPDDGALTPLERAQLIAILETALSVLRSPMAERGLLRAAKGVLGRAATRSAERGVEAGLGAAAGAGVKLLGEFISSLWPPAG